MRGSGSLVQWWPLPCPDTATLSLGAAGAFPWLQARREQEHSWDTAVGVHYWDTCPSPGGVCAQRTAMLNPVNNWALLLQCGQSNLCWLCPPWWWALGQCREAVTNTGLLFRINPWNRNKTFLVALQCSGAGWLSILCLACGHFHVEGVKFVPELHTCL